jgi:hypothetical protein
MAHYAKIENNLVTNIIVADRDFINSGHVGDPTSWVEILDDNGVSIHYAGIGFTYNATLNSFIPPKPFNSWLLVNNVWTAPVDMPKDDKQYVWNEETVTWIEISSVLPGE